MTTPTLKTRAMLATLNISMWAARKYDKKVTAKVNEEHGSDKDAGRYNKHLFGGTKNAATHAAIVNAASHARGVFYENTLAWSDTDGYRILPTENYLTFVGLMREERRLFDTALQSFIDVYEQLKAEARTHLNGMYCEADYPSVLEIPRRFRFSTDFSPIPDAADFRVDVPSDHMEAIEREVAGRVEAATGIAMRDAWNRLYDVAQRYRERMADLDRKPRQDLVDMSRDVIGVLGRLNVTADPQLEEMRRRVERDLLMVDAVTLRENPDVRSAQAQKAHDILTAMQGVMGGSR